MAKECWNDKTYYISHRGGSLELIKMRREDEVREKERSSLIQKKAERELQRGEDPEHSCTAYLLKTKGKKYLTNLLI